VESAQIEFMNSRRIEALLMLDGLKTSVRRVRDDLSRDFDPVVTSKLWNAEMDIEKGIALLHSEDASIGP
jgi:hypothetical protein